MVAVNSCRAVARREGRLWVVDVEGVGVTQGRSLTESQLMARDLVAVVREVDPQDVVIDFTVDLGAELRSRVEDARRLAAEAEAAQRHAAHASRAVVLALRESGLTGKDAAAVLEVSEQRVSQLLAAARTHAAGESSPGSYAVAG